MNLGFKERLIQIMDRIYEAKEAGDMITQEDLIIKIEEELDVGEQTAKKYIDDIERRNLLEQTSALSWKIKPKDEVSEWISS